MYRFVLLACLIGSAQCQCQQKNVTWVPSFGQQTGNTWVKSFESAAFGLAQDIITIDRNIQSFCNSYANHDMKELYGMDFYQLSVLLPEFSESNIVVKIIHRLLLISAEDCSKLYADVKLLPDVVDPKRAVWKYWQGQLVILIPYKVAGAQNKCGGPIDESVVIVPKQTTGNCVASCSRPSFGDGIIRDNVWHPSGGGSSQQGGFGQGGFGQAGLGQSAFRQGGFGQASLGHGGFGNGGVSYNGVFGSRNGK